MADKKIKNIPAFVSGWTDKYFHHSVLDVPLPLPNKSIIKFLNQFKVKYPLKLYRGINKYNKGKSKIMSQTYDKKIAKRYIGTDGKIITKEFIPEDILLDTTLLNKKQRNFLGYDYKFDDKEVLILVNNKI